MEATKVWQDLKVNLDEQTEKYRMKRIKEVEKEVESIVNNAHKEADSIIEKAKSKAKQALDILDSNNQ
jgi:F0F1-type ATP synthase membrane subunit b/b'